MFDVEIDILSNVNWNTETNFFFKVYGEDIIDTIIWIKFEIILFFQWQINITCIIDISILDICVYFAKNLNLITLIRIGYLIMIF